MLERLLCGIALLLVLTGDVHAVPLESVFSVQGELREGAEPANGSYDIEASLFNVATGGQAIATDTLNGVAVTDGLFIVELDYTTAPFEMGEQYWVGLSVRPAGTGNFVLLTPRTKLTASPYALGAVTVVPGAIGANQIDSTEVQRRIAGSCEVGRAIRAIGEDGSVTCEVDNDTTYSGANFATSNQACSAGQIVVSIDSSGTVVCADDQDTTYSGTDFALSDEACPTGLYSTGVSSTGRVLCETAPGIDVIQRPNYAFTVYDQGSDEIGFGLDMVIGPDGFPIMSHVDIDNGDLLVTHCKDPICISSTTSIVDSAVGTGPAFTSIEINFDGQPMIGYYDADDFSLKFALCNDAACAGGDETINTVDSGGVVGQYVSIGRGFQGNPDMVYYDASLQDLKYVHCDNPSCSVIDEMTVVDSDGDVGSHASLVMDGSRALVSYYDATKGDLKYVRCSLGTCRFGSPIVFASDGDVGYESKIFLNAGRPVVVFLDDQEDTFVVSCNSAFCTSPDSVNPTDVFFANSPPTGITASNGLPLLANSRLAVADVWICNDASCTSGSRERLPDINNGSAEAIAAAIDLQGYPIFAIGRGGDGIELVRCGSRNCRAP